MRAEWPRDGERVIPRVTFSGKVWIKWKKKINVLSLRDETHDNGVRLHHSDHMNIYIYVTSFYYTPYYYYFYYYYYHYHRY